MPIVGGLDIHRKQITFDYPGTVSGQVFVAYGGRVDVLQAPTVERRFETDDEWTAEALAEQLGQFFASGLHGFAMSQQ